MKAISLTLILFAAVLTVVAPVSAWGQKLTGTVNILMVIVDFSDDPGTLDSTMFENDWLTPLKDYFTSASQGQMSINATWFNEVIHLGQRQYYHHCTLATGCKTIWAGSDSPLKTLMDEGHIATISEGLVPAGGTASDVFYCIMYLTAQGVANQFPGWSIENQKPDVDSGHGYAMGFGGLGSSTISMDPGGTYGAAIHEIGHMVSAVYTHPAGYISAYEEMDSCYPCETGIFTRVDRSALTGTFNSWFGGWIPGSALYKFTPPTGGTQVLSPIEIATDQTRSPQGVQVLTGAGYSYLLECRRFVYPDDLIPTMGRPGTHEGVLILKATPGADPETQLMLAPTYTAPDRWESIFRPGDTFTDTDRDLTISVAASVGNGFPVTVTYGPGATAPIPDVGMIPWLTPPMNTYETVDIWVDSPINGFEKDAPSDPTRLRYGRRADAEHSVIGNGDDPAANEINLVYARVRNFGTAPVVNAVVHFEVTNPLGVGIRGATGWTRFGTVTSSDFPGLASIPPGGYTDVYAQWRPLVTFPPGTTRVAWHSCVRVIIDPLPGELVTSNQDGNGEQENIDYFEVSRPTLVNPYPPIHESIFLVNSADVPKDFYLSVFSELPQGWTLNIGDGSDHYVIKGIGTLDLPVDLTAPPDAPIGESYLVKVRAFTLESSVNGDLHSTEVGGLVLTAHTTLDTTLTISATATGQTINVAGTMTPPISGATVAVRYEPPPTSVAALPDVLQLATVDSSGKFTDTYLRAFDGDWKIKALWAGDDKHASAVSNEVTVTIAPPTGSLTVTILPAGAVTAGAQWTVDNGTPQASGATVPGLSVGQHSVAFTTISGWTAPSSQNVTIVADQTATASGTYTQTTSGCFGGTIDNTSGTLTGKGGDALLLLSVIAALFLVRSRRQRPLAQK